MEDRSNPSKEWNVSVLWMRNLGYMENIVRADIQKGSCRKTESQEGTKGERTLKTESECKRVGGVTLGLLPNLASESATARGEGRGVVGEIDISGLRRWRLI